MSGIQPQRKPPTCCCAFAAVQVFIESGGFRTATLGATAKFLRLEPLFPEHCFTGLCGVRYGPSRKMVVLTSDGHEFDGQFPGNKGAAKHIQINVSRWFMRMKELGIRNQKGSYRLSQPNDAATDGCNSCIG